MTLLAGKTHRSKNSANSLLPGQAPTPSSGAKCAARTPSTAPQAPRPRRNLPKRRRRQRAKPRRGESEVASSQINHCNGTALEEKAALPTTRRTTEGDYALVLRARCRLRRERETIKKQSFVVFAKHQIPLKFIRKRTGRSARAQILPRPAPAHARKPSVRMVPRRFPPRRFLVRLRIGQAAVDALHDLSFREPCIFQPPDFRAAHRALALHSFVQNHVHGVVR